MLFSWWTNKINDVDEEDVMQPVFDNLEQRLYEHSQLSTLAGKALPEFKQRIKDFPVKLIASGNHYPSNWYSITAFAIIPNTAETNQELRVHVQKNLNRMFNEVVKKYDTGNIIPSNYEFIYYEANSSWVGRDLHNYFG